MGGAIENLERGRRFAARGDVEAAWRCLAAVPADQPGRADAIAELGDALLDAGRAPEAERCYREALERDFGPALCYRLGDALLAQARWEEALACFEEVLKAAPDDAATLVMQGHAELGRGRTAEAVRAYERAVRLDPGQVGARYYMAEALLRLGEPMRAGAQLHYVLQREPRYQPGLVLKAEIALQLRDFRQAATEFLRAHAIERLDAPALMRLGDAFAGLGDADQALAAYEAAIAADATLWPAYAAAARLCEQPPLLALARRYWQTLGFEPRWAAPAREGLARVAALAKQHGLPPDGPPPVRTPLAEFTPPPAGGTGKLRPPAPARSASGPLQQPAPPRPGSGPAQQAASTRQGSGPLPHAPSPPSRAGDRPAGPPVPSRPGSGPLQQPTPQPGSGPLQQPSPPRPGSGPLPAAPAASTAAPAGEHAAPARPAGTAARTPSGRLGELPSVAEAFGEPPAPPAATPAEAGETPAAGAGPTTEGGPPTRRGTGSLSLPPSTRAAGKRSSFALEGTGPLKPQASEPPRPEAGR